jgi:hypothetical protein
MSEVARLKMENSGSSETSISIILEVEEGGCFFPSKRRYVYLPD